MAKRVHRPRLHNEFARRWHGAEAELAAAAEREKARYHAAAAIGDFSPR